MLKFIRNNNIFL